MKLPTPLNDKAEVLKSLIINGKVDCIKFSFLEGFRTRLSEIRTKHKVKLTFETKTKINRHGNKITYRVHKLEGQKNIDYAIGVYMIINKKKVA